MKKFIILILFTVLLLQSALAQTTGFRVFTKLDDAKFKFYFQGNLQNNFPVKEISFDSLDANTKYDIVISFTKDSIADIEEEIYLLKNEFRELEIKKQDKIKKKSAKFGRKVGKFLKIGKHDKENILYDVFYLDNVTKSDIFNN